MKKQKQTKTESTPAISQQVITEKLEKVIKYVVVREGRRVSAEEYATPSDSKAILERDFWARVAKNHSYGEKVEIVAYDSKYHRVW